MPVPELSVQIKNTPGQLVKIAGSLAEANVVVRGITASSAGRTGWVRIVPDNAQAATSALEDAGFEVVVGEAVLICLDEEPGSLDRPLQMLSDAGLNVDYIYVCSSSAQVHRLIVLGVQSPEKAEKLLQEHEIRVCDLRN